MMNVPKIRLAMFDLDGTLFDTEHANFLAYKDACGAEYPLSEKFFHECCMSRSYKEFLPELGVDESRLAEIHEKKIKLYSGYFSAIRQNIPLFDIAGLLRGGGAKLAVVTTASRTNTMELLRYFNCEDFFDLLVTQETVKNLKPSPDAYLYAMHHFGVLPEECVIFEDSDNGVKAAVSSGAAVYRIAS